MLVWLQKIAVVIALIVGASAVPAICTYLVIAYGHPGSDRPTPGPREGSYTPQQPATDKGNTATDDRIGTKATPLVVEVRHPPKGDPDTIADEEKEDRHAAAEWWNKWLTVSLVGATLAPAVILVYQGYWLRRSVQIAEKALTDLERAYVFVSVVTPLRGAVSAVPDGDGLVEIQVQIILHNHGKSPAVLRRMRGYTIIGPTPPQRLNDVPGTERRLPDGLVIGSAKAYVRDIPCRMTADEWLYIRNGNRNLYCCGLVDYEDVLGSAWTTGYCWVLVWRPANSEFLIIGGTPLNYRT